VVLGLLGLSGQPLVDQIADDAGHGGLVQAGAGGDGGARAGGVGAQETEHDGQVGGADVGVVRGLSGQGPVLFGSVGWLLRPGSVLHLVAVSVLS
jgi:hypothetical protein